MTDAFEIREIAEPDYTDWRTLWDGYNAFYGRVGKTALAEEITKATWRKFFLPHEPVHALVAEESGRVIGIAHFLFHRSTNRQTDVCYLQDLFTAEARRRLGVGRRLIEAVYKAAKTQGASRVYWHTQASNETARKLYDKLAQHDGFIVYTHDL